MTIFHSNHESFPPQMFCYIQYWLGTVYMLTKGFEETCTL